ncbi:hypothetical protein [uncultured Propionivibrio sp.]|uniref:hypothetical protein n=1 Tax=uncultured Propionivibrio sp. TaxID=426737 RepID=UPI0029C058A7|nr:hypothetical protein [uncultured Propionivibrio sp.]
MAPAAAVWIGECPTVAPTAGVLDTVSAPDGTARHLLASDTALPGCDQRQLPVNATTLRAGRLIARPLAEGLAPGFALSYEGAASELAQAEVIPRDATVPDDSPRILGNTLFGEIALQTFGIDGRASGSVSADALTLACRAGQTSGGALLRLHERPLPQGTRAAIRLRYTASAPFPLGLSDTRRLSAEDPHLLGTLDPGQPTVTLPLPPEGIDTNRLRAISLLCPPHAATLGITELSIVPIPGPAPASGRATWIWQPEGWRQADSAAFAAFAAAAIDTLFVTVPVDPERAQVVDADQLAVFVARATKAGIAVWAVAGDARAVLPSERHHFKRMARAYADYNRTAPDGAALAGIQYDIEPYLNRGYALDATPWLDAYADTIRELRAAADLPIDLALPFFWATAKTSRGPLLDAIAADADSITVMAYRTDPAQIRTLAQPFLEWGSRARRRVRIALEAGPIADTRVQHHAPATQGQLAIIIGERHGTLLEFTEPVAAAGLRSFAPTHTGATPGSAISFIHRRHEMLDRTSQLEHGWRSWPAFSGVALHEFFSPPPAP